MRLVDEPLGTPRERTSAVRVNLSTHGFERLPIMVNILWRRCGRLMLRPRPPGGRPAQKQALYVAYR
jgi:hypothetical protein